MRGRFVTPWLPVLALVLGSAPVRAREAQTVVSSAGMSLVVPSGWRRLGQDDGRVLLLSPGPGEEGVVIARHQAMILVIPVEGWRPGDDLGPAIRAGLGDDRIIARRTLRIGKSLGDCRVVEEVDTVAEVGPGTEQNSAGFYCMARGRAVLVQVTHWPRDRARARFRAAALAVVRSLQLGREAVATARQR